jgi:hypothetical protein
MQATAEPAQQQLPPGSAVVFVCDGHLDVGAKPGSSTRVHLRDALTLDGTVVAPAGTAARLVVGGVVNAGGKRQASITVEDFTTKYGLLPVRAKTALLGGIDPGVTIEATTLARVERIGDRIAIVVPFPFRLSTDVPLSVYTPTPAKTAPLPSARSTPHPTSVPTKNPLP